MVLQARQFFSSTVTMGDLIRNLVDSNVLFYKTAQGEARIEVIFNGDTFWMMNVWSRDVISARTTLMTCLNASEKSELPKDGIIKRLLTSMLNAVLIMMQNRIAQSCFSKWCRIWCILLSRTIRPLKSYIRGLMLRDQTVPFFEPQSYSGGVMRKRRGSPNAYLWIISLVYSYSIPPPCFDPRAAAGRSVSVSQPPPEAAPPSGETADTCSKVWSCCPPAV